MQKSDRVHFIMNKGKLERRDNNIVFIALGDDDEPIAPPKPLPINAIDEIYIMAKVYLDTETIAFCADSNILLHFFKSSGAFRGNFYPNTPNSVNKSGFVLLSQLRAFDAQEHRLYIAKQITKARLSNALTNLKNHKIDGFDKKALLESVDACSDTSAIMGVEGGFQQRYFESWNAIIKNQKSFKFTERSKRPPLDKINLLISYFNTRVYNVCLSEIYKTELDPRISFLHEPNFRSLSLHLDIAEIFKPLIADRLIWEMLNKEELKSDDFDKENGLPTFKKDTIKKVELKLIGKFTEQVFIGEQALNWRQIIRRDANRLKKCICEFGEYLPYGLETI